MAIKEGYQVYVAEAEGREFGMVEFVALEVVPPG